MVVDTSRLAICALTLCAASVCLAPACAEEGRARAEQLKAAYVFNFAKFVRWPLPKPEEALTVCFTEPSAVRAAFTRTVAGKTIGSHALLIRQIAPRQSIDECRILFIEAAALAAGTSVPEVKDTMAVLTVSDLSGFAQTGGNDRAVQRAQSVAISHQPRQCPTRGPVHSLGLAAARGLRRRGRATLNVLERRSARSQRRDEHFLPRSSGEGWQSS